MREVSEHVDTLRPPVVVARDLSKAFGGQRVLAGISFEVHAGDFVVLRGENGSGKTTLLNILTGNLKPDAGTIEFHLNGSPQIFRFPRAGLGNLNPLDRFLPESVTRAGIGRTWQDTRLFPDHTLVENLLVARRQPLGERPWDAVIRWRSVHEHQRSDEREAAEELSLLGLNGRGISTGDRVSMGQAKRVAILRALRTDARLLVLDEPLAGLDGDGVEGVLRYLRDLKAQGMTVIVVEHPLSVRPLLELATHVWRLGDGQMEIEHTPSHDGSRSIVDDLTEAFIGRGNAVVRRDELNGGATLIRLRSPARGGEGEASALAIHGVTVSRGRRILFQDQEMPRGVGLSFELRPGEVGILAAPNGWGKTSLLESISGLHRLHSGTILANGHPIQDLPAWRRARAGIRLARSREPGFQRLLVREALQVSDEPPHLPDLGGLGNREIGSLSGGEKQWVALTQFFATGGETPRVVRMLDEPFTGLDESRITEVLNQLVACPATLLIAVPTPSCQRVTP